VIGSTAGLLTDYIVGQGKGVTFITESGKTTPADYAIITGIDNAPELQFVYEGDTLIGDWALRPIWYYRIKLFSAALNKSLFLTDAKGNTEGILPYEFNGNTTDYHYAYFTDSIPASATYKAKGVSADEKFRQTFGFKYVEEGEDAVVPNSQDPNVQAFYVVSSADFNKTATPKPSTKYRYLAEVNNRFVFVDKKSDALIFQFGKKDANGVYDGIEVVGTSGIYGVEGGIKILGGSGKVDVYTIDGRLIKSAIITSADQTIPAPKGVAIVKNGSKVGKVVVK
jgi:hypothetical protein